jgi:hypothetical protein
MSFKNSGNCFSIVKISRIFRNLQKKHFKGVSVNRILALSVNITKPITKRENAAKLAGRSQISTAEIDDYDNQFDDDENFLY